MAHLGGHQLAVRIDLTAGEAARVASPGQPLL